MKKPLTTWILVITGIIFNIGSAVITHYFIGLNNQALNQLEQQVNQFETLIESAWRNKTEVERKQEFLLLLLNQVKGIDSYQASVASKHIAAQLSLTIQQHQLSPDLLPETLNFDSIINISDKAKLKIINDINETYLEKIEIENDQLPLKEQNSLLLTVAIFLQVTGLILVLARDFRF